MSDFIQDNIEYGVKAVAEALDEWNDLNHSIKLQFKKKLSKVKFNPKVPKNALSGLKDCYKVKLKRAGYRLVYQVVDDKIILIVWVIDKREDSQVYKKAHSRLKQEVVDNELKDLPLD